MPTPALNSDLIGNTIKFNTRASIQLGNSFANGVKVDSIMSYTQALKDEDVAAVAAQIQPLLNPFSVNPDPSTYLYIKVIFPTGVTKVLGIPWIDPASVEIVSSYNYIKTIFGLSESDVAAIDAAILALGFTNTNGVLQPQ